MFYLKTLYLNQFRQFTSETLEFSPHVNIIYGPNAVGKTTIIEAINALALCQSFRTSKDNEMIQYNKDYCFAKGLFIEETNKVNEHNIVFSLSNEGKRIKKDEKTFAKLSEYIGYYKTVVFSPQDLELVQGAPAVRRKFMDLYLCQIDGEYLNSSIKYRKWLKERNELFKNESIDQALMKIITDNLIKEGLVLTHKRQEFIQNINTILKEKMSIINNQEEVAIQYIPSYNQEDYLDYIYETNYEHDRLTQSTHVGPHHDDLKFKINGMDAMAFASQGQQRSIVLALKSAVSAYLSLDERIIVAFDDVFSELDEARQQAILKLIGEDNQVFLTTASEKLVENLSTSGGKLIKIGGKL